MKYYHVELTGSLIKPLRVGFILLLVLATIGCRKEVDDYFYSDTEEYVDIELLTLLNSEENYSSFLSILDTYNIDTLFEKGRTVTMFVPTNEVVESMGELHLDTIDWIKYLITESYINIAQIRGAKKIQTSGGKFSVIRNSGGTAFFNDAEITLSGPLCKDGKYYELSGIAQPLPSLYEFIELTNPFYKSYIDSQDSSYLDLGLSRPTGFDPEGNTIYDTVLTTVNLFEKEFFPLSQEFRSKKATMLLFSQEQFDDALYLIAEDLGLPSQDNIPDQWKTEVLLPYLSDQGVFWNDLGSFDFSPGRIRNIKGDSVNVDPANIDYNSSFECSNGRAYNYLNFVVPDSIYKGSNIIQGEQLVFSKGSGLYDWKDGVVVTGKPVNPVVGYNKDADNDSTLVVRFDEANSSQAFSMNFTFNNIFPGSYRLMFRFKTTPSGVFQILVNGIMQDIDLGYGVSDRVDIWDLDEPVRSITKEVYREENGFNSFDLLVENITEYGEVDITLLYVEPGQRSNNGFILDYVLLENFKE